ncbi:uncharacterized protein LOC124554098 isoform X1 [Schistocerca americana]|uniref:uncharacterized protein LOC124554098 isoform X1 n=1 Tax=Schistocerca americana TaxID=7009 RepID=UPI001F4FF28E|nr:uncharacterized protein LOC124554098 isoform X1 [Schistocerca americana]
MRSPRRLGHVPLTLLLLSLPLPLLAAEKDGPELWESGDVGGAMHVDGDAASFERVELRCGADAMHVRVATARDFRGVLYTRGSFHERRPPCFLDADGGTRFSMQLPLDACNALNEGDVRYRNVVVLQHDDEFVAPGDAAFTLECDFSQPRSVAVAADLSPDSGSSADGKPVQVSSRISLVDPDPASDSHRQRRADVDSDSDAVSLTPDDVLRRRRRNTSSKDEL